MTARTRSVNVNAVRYQMHSTVTPTSVAALARRWTGAAMRGRAAKQIDAKGFRRLKAHTQRPTLPAALHAIQAQHDADNGVAPEAVAA